MPSFGCIVVVKSQAHFCAWWTYVASLIIDCDPPGIASNDLTTFNFKNKKQKLYSLDQDAVYPEQRQVQVRLTEVAE